MAISLTAGMRSNLFSLQQTAKLMDQTAIRLNTGKKVNSALDDPISFFAAKDHMSRASDLETLKNGMSESIQTITAANNGIESIIDLLDAAKAKAESAKSAEDGSGCITQTVTLSGVTVGDTITLGGNIYTAGTETTGRTFEASAAIADSVAAANLMTLINSNDESNPEGAAGSTGVIDIEATAINGSKITLGTTGVDMIDSHVTSSSSTHFGENMLSASGELTSLKGEYDALLAQINTLATDAQYKGTNLLASDDLTVDFEGNNSLSVLGFSAANTDLNVTSSTWVSANNTTINNDILSLETAVATLESKASGLASSLSIVTVRQDFTENMINTLTTGADNLTLADMNEEGANMLMLQTQQALGTNSLSLAAQTAQGVLRLF